MPKETLIINVLKAKLLRAFFIPLTLAHFPEAMRKGILVCLNHLF
jgi:hypothetical protein